MRHELELPEALDDCPTWWQNLVKNTNGPSGRDRRIAQLLKYQGRITRTPNDSIIIIFDDPVHYTWFLLQVHTDNMFTV